MIVLLIVGSVSVANAQRGYLRGGFHGRYGGWYGGRIVYGRPVYNIRLGYRAFYNPYFGFSSGAWFGSLPYGYYPFYYGLNPYFYYGGIFYQHSSDHGYKVADAPVGAEVPDLPDNANPMVVDGKPYFEYGGVYYAKLTKTDGIETYIVAGRNGVLNPGDINIEKHLVPAVGDVTAKLPKDVTKVKADGKKYWVTPSGIYLEKIKIGQQNVYRVTKLSR